MITQDCVAKGITQKKAEAVHSFRDGCGEYTDPGAFFLVPFGLRAQLKKGDI